MSTTTVTAATRPRARSNKRTAGPSAKAITIANATGTKIACARERTATINTTVASVQKTGRSERDGAAGTCVDRGALTTRSSDGAPIRRPRSTRQGRHGPLYTARELGAGSLQDGRPLERGERTLKTDAADRELQAGDRSQRHEAPAVGRDK